MTLIAGAGKYLNAATLANLKGTAAQSPTLLDDSATSLLQAARSNINYGIGLSASARAFNESFLNRTSDINQMFSLGLGSDATLDGMKQQILALRAKTPTSRLATSILDLSEVTDDGTIPADTTTGTNVDTDA
jgi:hypothetical protein